MPRIRKDKMARSYAEPFWKIGLYIRLSREDDNEDESESCYQPRKDTPRLCRQAILSREPM